MSPKPLVTSLLADLKRRRLWPVAVLLLAALVAVPFVLGQSSSSAPSAPAPVPPVSGLPSGPAVPIVSVEPVPSHARLRGRQHDPFAPTTATTTTTTSTTTASPQTTTTTPTSTHSGAGAGGSGSGSGATSPGSSTTTTTTTTTPTSTPKPPAAPGTLRDTESYAVTVALTDSAGNLNTIDSLERLSALPSDRAPLLVDLGVLKGGRRVLFAVLPYAIAQGAGHCIPGPVDCEMISLAPGEIEKLSLRLPSGAVGGAGSFAVTGISAAHHPSADAARRARTHVDSAGHGLLSRYSNQLPALSLFTYRAASGAVFDLRNLSVGGSK